MSAEKVAELRADGYGIVCSTCHKMWAARDRKQVSCGESECGGPISGKSFPMYEGAIKAALATLCFVCGNAADAGICCLDSRIIGVCNDHKRFLDFTPNSPRPAQRGMSWVEKG